MTRLRQHSIKPDIPCANTMETGATTLYCLFGCVIIGGLTPS